VTGIREMVMDSSKRGNETHTHTHTHTTHTQAVRGVG
jgi:hypothetical protein